MYTRLGRDGRGNILFVHNFEPNKISYHMSGKGRLLFISTEVPVAPSLHKLELYFGTRKVGQDPVTLL